jgi:hypothetical protein
MKVLFGHRAAPARSGLVARRASLVTTAIALVLFFFAPTTTAFADCRCLCVNGELAAICTGNLSVQPTCAPRLCPAVGGSVSMAQNRQASAQGGSGSGCAPRQVLDPVSGKYEWQVLCR